MSTHKMRDQQMFYFYNCLLKELPTLHQAVQQRVLMRIWRQLLRAIPSIKDEFENSLKEDERDIALENYAAIFGMSLTPGGIAPVVRRPLNHLGIPPLRDNTGMALSYQEFFVDLMNFFRDYLPAIVAKNKLSATTIDRINNLTKEFLEQSNSTEADKLIRQKLKEARRYVPG